MEIQGIFLKRQHEQVIGAFINRVFLMLDQEEKSIEGYSITAGVESAKIRLAPGIVVKIAIEVESRPEVAPISPPAPTKAEPGPEPDIEGHVCIPSDMADLSGVPI
jgi:hypothetical protein